MTVFRIASPRYSSFSFFDLRASLFSLKQDVCVMAWLKSSLSLNVYLIASSKGVG